MKFRFINVHNVNHLVPHWAVDPMLLARTLDHAFGTEEGADLLSKDIFTSLNFWVEINSTVNPPSLRICTADENVDLSGRLVIDCHSVLNDIGQIDLPLNAIFKGYPTLDGTYSVYCHSLQTETPLAYVGLTKQRWFDRYGQHVSSARTGSPYLFHAALRSHIDVPIMHRVFLYELAESQALDFEEEFVEAFGLYPLGLNMIPGGRAGFEYLARLGHRSKTSEEREALVERLASQSSLKGRPNPLCAARWESDPDYVERVICGHNGRLSATQVRAVRRYANMGHTVSTITRMASARNERQVHNVLAGRTYSRIQ